jgi:hypothetical protein
MGLYGGNGLTPSLGGGLSTNRIALKAGAVWTIPSGWFMIRSGPYTTIQQYDAILGIWFSIGGGGFGASVEYVHSDGQNYRLANQNGCVVGAVITNVGSGYTTAPTIAAGSGGAIFKTIIGGAVSQTVTVSNGGTNYTYPPTVQIAAPPPGGVQATAYCTLTSGVVTSVTMVDQGAGYASAPTMVFQNDPREGLNGTTVGSGATAVTSLTGSGTITAAFCVDHGTPIAFTAGSATSIPTLTLSSALNSAAVTAIMNWSITGLQSGTYGNGASGVGGSNATQVTATGVDQPTAANSTVLNTAVQSNLVRTRQALLTATESGGTLPAYGSWVVRDGGIYTGTPLLIISAPAGPAAGALTTALATMGYFASDTSYIEGPA